MAQGLPARIETVGREAPVAIDLRPFDPPCSAAPSIDTLRTLLDIGSDAVEIIDHAGRIRFANASALSAHGYTELAEIAGRAWFDVWPARHAAAIELAFDAAMRGQTSQLTVQATGRPGRTRDRREIRIAPVRVACGRAAAVLAVSRRESAPRPETLAAAATEAVVERIRDVSETAGRLRYDGDRIGKACEEVAARREATLAAVRLAAVAAGSSLGDATVRDADAGEARRRVDMAAEVWSADERVAGDGAAMADLIAEGLRPLRLGAVDHRTSGPELAMPPQAACVMIVVLDELSRGAVARAASIALTSIALTWRPAMEDALMLEMRWVETGAATTAAEDRRVDAIISAIGGEIRDEADGVTLRLPLTGDRR